MRVIPRCSAGQWLASGTVRDVGCDDREDKPGGQEPPPVKFGSKVERNYPHLEQSHQLEDSSGEVLEDACTLVIQHCLHHAKQGHSFLLSKVEMKRTSQFCLF